MRCDMLLEEFVYRNGFEIPFRVVHLFKRFFGIFRNHRNIAECRFFDKTADCFVECLYKSLYERSAVHIAAVFGVENEFSVSEIDCNCYRRFCCIGQNVYRFRRLSADSIERERVSLISKDYVGADPVRSRDLGKRIEVVRHTAHKLFLGLADKIDNFFVCCRVYQDRKSLDKNRYRRSETRVVPAVVYRRKNSVVGKREAVQSESEGRIEKGVESECVFVAEFFCLICACF